MNFDSAVRLDDSTGNGSSWRFSGRVATITASSAEEVEPALSTVAAAADAGQYGVGFVAYEAASALNPHLPTRPPQAGLPLVWFALFERRVRVAPAVDGSTGSPAFALGTGPDETQYRRTIADIRAQIAAGACYQVNYTFPRIGAFPDDPEILYRQIVAAQKARYCAWLDTGRFLVMSASPELFFRRDGDRIVTCPMKGTIARGRSRIEDLERAGRLAADPKERAENLMIVDLLRNDLGMVAETGSVTVDALFTVETYPTIHQMTSTISARLRPETTLVQLFRALFPCGSVTGAPKKKAMEIITERESAARGVYCGAVGMVAPGGEAVFSVAIRTLVCDRQQRSVTMGTGSGITWDSDADAELRECRTKGLFAARPLIRSGLIESLRLDDGEYARLERHLARMAWSAGQIGIPFDRRHAAGLLRQFADGKNGLHKVRLLLSADGAVSITAEKLEETPEPVRIGIAATPVDPEDLTLYLKLDDRSRYERARNECPDAEEVLLTNCRGELTEGSYHNLVVKLNGRLVTPPLSAGLLPGIMRECLLEEGVISELALYPADLHDAAEIWLVNSVRGWRPGVLAPA